MTEEEFYNALIPMIGTLHTIERGYWQQKWLETISMEEAEALLHDLKNAAHYLAMLRNKLNHLTLVGEPTELELTTLPS